MKRQQTNAKVNAKLAALKESTELLAGRVDAQALRNAQQLIKQTDRRLRFAGEDTVIALAGATGSGKSSLFNAISGTKLAEPGMKRPTTANTLAAYWGTELPNDLLDWLEVPRRQLVNGDTSLLNGLVLMDLPDHDSTEVTHKLEVDRLVGLVDMLIWVVDPQKYADAALHEQYLVPMAKYAEVMLVVLNQADRLGAEELRLATRDLRKLLDSEGLADAKLVTTSALTGQGVEALRQTIAQMVREKNLAAKKLVVSLDQAAEALLEKLGDEPVASQVDQAAINQFNQGLATSIGVDQVSQAVFRATTKYGRSATAWPFISWWYQLRPDPLKKLHLPSLTDKPDANQPVQISRTSINRGPVSEARFSSNLRDIGLLATAGLPDLWAQLLRGEIYANRNKLADQADVILASTDLQLREGTWWWGIYRVLQWLVCLAALAGIGWKLFDLVLAYLGLGPSPKLIVAGMRLDSLLLIAGLGLGVVLSVISRFLVSMAAKSKANQASKILRAELAQLADQLVFTPLNSELARYHNAKAKLRTVLKYCG